LLPSLNRFEDATVKGLIIHLRKDLELLRCGSNTADLSKVLLCCVERVNITDVRRKFLTELFWW